MAFTQSMTVRAASADPLADLLDSWHGEQHGTAPGYQGSRLLADQEQPGRFVIEVDFSDKEDADKNNKRPETQAWADKLRGLVQGEPEYHNYEVIHRTG
jgi:quinol monooxygenase YgiN